MSTAHERVADAIRNEISTKRWKVGDRLPGELNLASRFQVSRNTVRRALETLEAANLVRRHQGKGTFVADQGISHISGDLRSFTEIIRSLGMTPGVLDIEVTVDPNPPEDAKTYLPGSKFWLIERVRTANHRPFCIMQSWLPDTDGWDISPDQLKQRQSLYDLLEAKDRRPAHATEVIRAEAATAAEARTLDVEHGSPLLTMYRWTSDSRGRPIEYVRSTSPGTLYEYVIRLRQ